jgi:hypothetical protein
MSVPGFPVTQQRYAIDSNATGIASMLLSVRLNAEQFNKWVASFTDAQLLAAPYNYTDDELYALRRFGELAAAYAAIQGAGGTLSPEDGALLVEIGTKYSGMSFVQPRMPAVGGI